MRTAIIASSGLLATFCCTFAVAAPPRLIARELPVPATDCGWQGMVQGFGTALGADGSVAGLANCGTTAYGSAMFFISPNGTVSDLDDGTFTFTSPDVIIGTGVVAGTGNWCPPLNGPCTTALMVAEVGQEIDVIGSGDFATVVNDGNMSGWVCGWGAVSKTDAWRLRPDRTLEPLNVAGGWAIYAEWIAENGWTAGHAYVGSQYHAIRWSSEDSMGTVLPSLVSGTSSSAAFVGVDGTVVGRSGDQAVMWDPSGTPHALLPLGSESEATHIAGNPMLATPQAIAFFGAHDNNTKLFRADMMSGWLDIVPTPPAGHTLLHIQVTAAPTPNLMLATAHTSMYAPVQYMWTPETGLAQLETFIVNHDFGTGTSELQVVDANAMGQILVNGSDPKKTYMLEFLAMGDVNGDSIVDGADLGLLLGAWGTVPTGPRNAADFDGNGVVDGADLGVLLGEWSM